MTSKMHVIDQLETTFTLPISPYVFPAPDDMQTSVATSTTSHNPKPEDLFDRLVPCASLLDDLGGIARNSLRDFLQNKGNPEISANDVVAADINFVNFERTPVNYLEDSVAISFTSLFNGVARVVEDWDKLFDPSPAKDRVQCATRTFEFPGFVLLPDKVWSDKVSEEVLVGVELKGAQASEAGTGLVTDTGLFRRYANLMRRGEVTPSVLKATRDSKLISLLYEGVVQLDRFKTKDFYFFDGVSLFAMARSANDPRSILVSPLQNVSQNPNFLPIIMSRYYISSNDLNRAFKAKDPLPLAKDVEAAPAKKKKKDVTVGEAEKADSSISMRVKENQRTKGGQQDEDAVMTPSGEPTFVFEYPDQCTLLLIDITTTLLPSMEISPASTSSATFSALQIFDDPDDVSPEYSQKTPPTPPRSPPTSPFQPTEIEMKHVPSNNYPPSPALMPISPLAATRFSLSDLPSHVQLASFLGKGRTSRVWRLSIEGKEVRVVAKISRRGMAKYVEEEARILAIYKNEFNLHNIAIVAMVGLLKEVSGEETESGATGMPEEKVVALLEDGGEACEVWSEWTLAQRLHLFLSLLALHQRVGLLHGDAFPRNSLSFPPTAADPTGGAKWTDLGCATEGHECVGRGCYELENVCAEMRLNAGEDREVLRREAEVRGLRW